MSYRYKISEQDYLTFQLFSVSTNPRFKTQKKRGRWVLSLSLLALALLFFKPEKLFLTAAFFISAVAVFYFYPKFFLKRYKAHFLVHVKDQFQDSIGKEITLTIDHERISSKDDQGAEVNLSLEDLSFIQEIKGYYFLIFKEGKSQIIPKERLEDQDSLVTDIENLVATKKVELRKNLNWKWI